MDTARCAVGTGDRGALIIIIISLWKERLGVVTRPKMATDGNWARRILENTPHNRELARSLLLLYIFYIIHFITDM